VVWLLSRDRRSLDMLSVKKEAKLLASEIPGVEEGKGDGDLRCRSLSTACQTCLVVLLRYPKPTPKPRVFFAKTVRRQNLGFPAIIDGFWAHLHAKII